MREKSSPRAVLSTTIRLNRQKMGASQNKAELRKYIRSKLSSMSADEMSIQSAKISDRIKRLDLPTGSICIYNSLDSEVDTREIIDYFLGKREVYLPVVEGDDILLVKADKNSEYRAAKWGILEPIGERLSPNDVDPKITLTPLLGADRKLNRLGKGKGFYDRYFAKIETLKIGLAFNEQIVDEIPCEDTDIPLDILVSASEVLIR
ncbi:MAG: 5-formyltetrahydrofolate cyclo-ligase [Clostridia bacterium]|nr:5-formyltetrahydrofolate cyclo-ligase [Clostridia bacterium]